MDWDRYKALCDSPDTFSRWMLEQTLELLADRSDEPLRSRLRSVLNGDALDKPADHRGGARSDMFPLALTGDDARRVLAAVTAAVSRGETTSATRSRGLGGFVEAWGEYVRYLERRPGGAERHCSPRS
jgi:hypothetical protein